MRSIGSTSFPGDSNPIVGNGEFVTGLHENSQTVDHKLSVMRAVLNDALAGISDAREILFATPATAGAGEAESGQEISVGLYLAHAVSDLHTALSLLHAQYEMDGNEALHD
ncbi:hypothetical protein G9444_0058 [Rhodococcus erythropolis]|jgi:hypothetical protein|uniref:Uncharacterized protein n=1 Tax=Rhodococcus erythropolis TaxID=1833 RepID=A0A6G9CKA0_RHOER|nr:MULTISPECIES: hypothetical protein [Rhodococcus]MCJ0900238.1 hypothetical protein [Rhodococcus sp. ARC_M13]OFE08167.1 hypothetical protein A5N83_14205 [Rhodococcus sp. 1139]QIP37302.1 hypothetical protein G9444_0058 [Rhodococcus erythropolis]UGQ51177.1 hypothetical protein LRL17_24645 [Rhodococcus qingshengii]UKO86697.1 hypothetical protein ITJ47_02440 [Rhodococcus erythropolis]